jgi:NADPH-dependent 2,4-dienoyl-CoA reductase/sulfur reductase-like enzyme
MKTVIIGGVAGGASTATRLRRVDEKAQIIILDVVISSLSPTAACPTTSVG